VIDGPFVLCRGIELLLGSICNMEGSVLANVSQGSLYLHRGVVVWVEESGFGCCETLIMQHAWGGELRPKPKNQAAWVWFWQMICRGIHICIGRVVLGEGRWVWGAMKLQPLSAQGEGMWGQNQNQNTPENQPFKD
jgi:hypothetical protein